MNDPRQIRLLERARMIRRLRAGGNDFYERTLDAVDGAWVTLGGKRYLHFCSYSYLGLSSSRELVDEAVALARPFCSGGGASRVGGGTTRLHLDLEREIADWLGVERCLLLPTGFAANSTFLAALTSPGDIVLADEAVHASIKDGLLLARCRSDYFRHQNLDDLRSRLEKAGDGARWVVVDGVYSMEGDVAPLPELQRLCDEFGAFLYVDDAHGLGVLGEEGAGVHRHFDVKVGPYELLMATISKSVTSIGAFAAGSAALIDALMGNCRGFIFSVATPPFNTALALAAIRHLRANGDLLRTLWERQKTYVDLLSARGLRALNTATPIVPLMCRDNAQAFAITKHCEARKLLVLPAIYPVVPLDAPRIRTTVTAAMSREDIAFAVDVLAEAFARIP